MKTFSPDTPFQRKWDVFILLSILYNAFIIPFSIGFNYNFGPTITVIDFLVDGLFLTDVFLRFFRGYYHEGLLVTDQKLIRKRYLNTWFPWDFVASFPLDGLALLIGIEYFGGYAMLPYLRLPRLLRLGRIFLYFRNWEKDIQLNPSILRIVKLAMSVLMSAHWIACAWFSIALSESEHGISWIVAHSLVDAHVVDQYVRSLYWALTTMTTVGYGDITPNTTIETVFTMVAMCTGVSIYAYIVGNMASLIANLDSTAQAFRQKMDSINNYMRFREIPPDLQNRIRRYYDYVWARNKGLDEEQIIAELPSALHTDVALYLHREILEKVPLFHGAEQSFLNSLVMVLEPQIVSPGDYIIRHGEIGREMFFISKGTVEVVSGDGKTVFATLSDGAFFGEIALLFSERRTASIKATTFCDLFCLTKENVEAVLKDYPEFEEKMLKVANERYKKNS